MTPHIKRWLTGILAVPILFALIYFGSEILFFLLVLLLTLAAVSEYNALSAFSSGWEKGTGFAAAVVLPTAAYAGEPALILSATTLLFIAAFLLFLGRLRGPSFDLVSLQKVVFGLLYIPLLMSHLILLRHSAQGMIWIFFMIVLAFSGDITAFYVGRKIGRKKLFAEVSAGKTVEGTAGSIIGSVAACLLFAQGLLPDVPLFHIIAIAILGNVIGELGDLCESVLKRAAGVKDSGILFPGHGGVLDRLDCILFIAPFLFYYKHYLIK